MKDIAQNQGLGILPVSTALSNRWVAYLDAAPKTIETYARAIRQFICFLSEQDIVQPTRTDVLAYRHYLSQGKKPATVQLYLMAVKQFFKWTAQEGLYPNISSNIKGAKLDSGFKRDYLTSSQAKSY